MMKLLTNNYRLNPTILFKVASIVTFSILFILSGCGGGSSSSGSDTQTSGSQNNANNATNTCAATYTTADLNGCFSPDNSGWLSYYCFDGVGGWFLEDWNAIAGCSGQIKSGNYAIAGCTLTSCDNTGCTDQTVQASNSGVYVDGVHYTQNNGCN